MCALNLCEPADWLNSLRTRTSDLASRVLEVRGGARGSPDWGQHSPTGGGAEVHI